MARYPEIQPPAWTWWVTWLSRLGWHCNALQTPHQDGDEVPEHHPRHFLVQPVSGFRGKKAECVLPPF